MPPCSSFNLTKHTTRRRFNTLLLTPNASRSHRHKIYNSIKKQRALTKTNNIVINLSLHKKLTLAESALLNKGLNFCISSHKFNPHNSYTKDISRFIRSLQLKYLFLDSPDTPILKFSGNPDWNPPPKKCSDAIKGYGIYLNKQLRTIIKKNKIRSNISKHELRALSVLRKDRSILIQKADKGGGIIIMDSSTYLSKIETMLTDPITYTETSHIDLIAAKTEVNRIISALFDQDLIHKSQKKISSKTVHLASPISTVYVKFTNMITHYVRLSHK